MAKSLSHQQNQPIYLTFCTSGLFLFLLMLFVPTSYQSAKALLLAINFIAITWLFLEGKLNFRIHKSILIWVFVVASTGILFITIGLSNGAPGALRVSTVYVLWPIIFAIFVGTIPGIKGIQALLRTLAISGIILGLYSSMYIANAMGWWPNSLYWNIDQGQAIGFYKGFMEYNMYSISVLIITVPILAGLIVSQKEMTSTLPKAWLWIAYVLCFGLAILSGRRALWIVLLLAPVIFFLLATLQPTNSYKFRESLSTAGLVLAVSLIVYFVLAAIFNLSVEKMAAYLIASVPAEPSSAHEEAASLRYQEALSLWQGWIHAPWLGNGHGSCASVIRSNEMPWAYELSYLALLFHTGIIGVLLYGSCFGWVYWQGVIVIRKSSVYGSQMLAILTGTTCFLIANATNPYLEKFDSMWVIFLPLAIINRYLLENAHNKELT